MYRGSWWAPVYLSWSLALRLWNPLPAHITNQKNQRNPGIYISLKQPLTNDWQVLPHTWSRKLWSPTLSPEIPCGMQPKLPGPPPPPHCHCGLCLVFPHCSVCFLPLSTAPLSCWPFLGSHLTHRVHWILTWRSASREHDLRWQPPQAHTPGPFQWLWHWPSSFIQRAL